MHPQDRAHAGLRNPIHRRGPQSLEILLVAPWKMYDALLLKASKRKFQCLDISNVLCSIRPYGYTLVPVPRRVPRHPQNPHRDRKVGINVNRMSARPRKTALQWCIKGSLPLLFHSASQSLLPRILLSLPANAFSFRCIPFPPCHLSLAGQTSLLPNKTRVPAAAANCISWNVPERCINDSRRDSFRFSREF